MKYYILYTAVVIGFIWGLVDAYYGDYNKLLTYAIAFIIWIIPSKTCKDE